MREVHDLEPEARREYCKAVRFKVGSRCLQRFDYSWVRASLSRISSDREILLKLNVGREHIRKPKMARSHGTIKRRRLLDNEANKRRPEWYLG